MYEDLKRNIEQEKKIVLDMRSIAISMQNDPRNKEFYVMSLRALADQLYFLNDSLPDLLKGWSPMLSEKFREQEEGAEKERLKRESMEKSRIIKPEKKIEKLNPKQKWKKSDIGTYKIKKVSG